MTPTVAILFDTQARWYIPGTSISFAFRLLGVEPENVERVELSVIWYTEGKGDEELCVVHFKTIPWDEHVRKVREGEGVAGQEKGDTPTSASMTAALPHAPLSYVGKIFKIRWAVRVRVFPKIGREFSASKMFQLGSVPEVNESLN